MKKTLQAGPAAASLGREAAEGAERAVPELELLDDGEPERSGQRRLTSLIRKTRLRAEATMICLVRKSQAGLSS